MSLLGIFSSDGCSGSHHFGEWDDDLHKTRTQFTRNGLRVEVYQRRSCQHDGCNEVETRWADVRSTSEREIEAFREGNFLELALSDEQYENLELYADELAKSAEGLRADGVDDTARYVEKREEILREILEQ